MKGLFGKIFRVRKGVLDGPGMIDPYSYTYIEYYHGGGDLGDCYRLIYRPDEGVSMERYETANAEPERKNVKGDDIIYNRCRDILMRYNMRDWRELPARDVIALDEASTTITIDFPDRHISVNTNSSRLPNDGYEGIAQLREALEDAVG